MKTMSEHIIPRKTYVGIWIALMCLTALTAGLSYIDFGAFSAPVALLIATIKGSLVVGLFWFFLSLTFFVWLIVSDAYHALFWDLLPWVLGTVVLLKLAALHFFFCPSTGCTMLFGATGQTKRRLSVALDQADDSDDK